jgi:F-type H+-transporting ATPase subunit b
MNYDAIAFWSQIAGFVLFAIFVVWGWSKWLTPAIAASQRASNERIALAERRRDEMQAALKLLDGEIEGARRDAEAMKVRVAERARLDGEQIIAEAKESGERTVRNAQGELGRAREAARADLREQLASRALEIARGEAASQLDAAGDARIVSEFIGLIERGAVSS